MTRRADAVSHIVSIIEDRSATVISFANAHTVDAARRDLAFRKASRDILFFNDGIGVDVWSRIVWGKPFPENCNGTDLMPDVVAALPAGTHIYLIGDQAKVVGLAADQLQRLNPGVVISGMRSGFFAPEQQDEIIAAITPEVDLVLAALGQPKQEMFALEVAGRTQRPVVCVGVVRFCKRLPVPSAEGDAQTPVGMGVSPGARTSSAFRAISRRCRQAGRR